MGWLVADFITENDVIIQDGVFAYNFKASGAIKKGQCVGIAPVMDNCVMAPNTADAGPLDCVGIATMDAADKQWVAVAGPGNLCRALCAAASPVGTALYGGIDGIFTATQGNATKVSAYVVELPAKVKSTATSYLGKVLLV